MTADSSQGGGSDAWWRTPPINGVTLYPWATMDVDAVLEDLSDKGANTVFVITKESDGHVFFDSELAPNTVPERDILAELVAAGTDHDVRIVPVFFALCDGYLLQQHPEAVQVARDETELRYPNVSFEWMHWVCPNHEVVRDHLVGLAEELAEYDIDGVRFAHLEFQPVRSGDIEHRSCFCEECLERYEELDEDTSVTDDRCATITSFVRDLSAPFTDDPDVGVNLQCEAFADVDATLEESRDVLGVDIQSLAQYSDFISPRTAHVDMDLHPLWIRDVTRWFRKTCELPVVPTIRVSKEDDPSAQVSEDELFTSIQMALHGQAGGVNVFSTGANVGCITDEQWSAVERSFSGMDDLFADEPIPVDDSV